MTKRPDGPMHYHVLDDAEYQRKAAMIWGQQVALLLHVEGQQRKFTDAEAKEYQWLRKEQRRLYKRVWARNRRKSNDLNKLQRWKGNTSDNA